MQLAIRPWITAGVVLAATGAIAVTPVVAPDIEHRAVALTTIGQDISNLQDILAGVIDPGLAGAPAQAADTAAATDLAGAATVLTLTNSLGAGAANSLAVAEQDITGNDFVSARGADAAAITPNATAAFADAGTAQADAAQAAAALSADDPIQMFQADLQADWSQLVSGDVFSSTTLADLIATLDAAPAAAQEFIAELIDPAADGQVTAYDDANMAAELAATAAQEYKAAATAAEAAVAAPATAAGDTTITADTAMAVSDVSAATTDGAQSATDVTDALDALSSATPTATLADLGTDLGALWSDLWAALGL